PSGAAAEGVTPSPPPPPPCPEEKNMENLNNTEPESESENESEGEEALTAAMRTLHVTDKTIVKKAQPWTLPPSTIT
ncbi:unnamed protein product, partial [Bubo scandiacus]